MIANTLEQIREEFSLPAATKFTPLPDCRIPQVGYTLPFAAKSVTDASGKITYPPDPNGRIEMHAVSYKGEAAVEAILCREMAINIDDRALFIRWIIDHTIVLSSDPTLSLTIEQHFSEMAHDYRGDGSHRPYRLSTHAIAKLKHFVSIQAPKRIAGNSGGGNSKENISMVWWLMIYGGQNVENAIRIADAFHASCSMIDSAPILALANSTEKSTNPEVRIIPIIVPTDHGALIMVTFVIKLFPQIIQVIDQRGKAGIDLYGTIVRGTNGEICVPPPDMLISKTLAFYRGVNP